MKYYYLCFVFLLSCNQYKSEYSPIFEQMYETLEIELQQGLETLESTMTNVSFVLQEKGDSLDKIWVLRRGEEIIEKTEAVIFWIEAKKEMLWQNKNPEKVLEISKKKANLFLEKLESFTRFLNQKNTLWKLNLPSFPHLVSMKNVDMMTEEGENIPDDFMSLKFENVSTESALLTLVEKQVQILEQGRKLLYKLTEDYQAEFVYNFEQKLKVNILSKNDSTIKTEVVLSFSIFGNEKKMYPKKLIWDDSIYNFRTAETDIFWKTQKIGENTKKLKAIFYDAEAQKDTILEIQKTFWVKDTVKVEENEELEILENEDN